MIVVMAFEYKICYMTNFLYTLTFCLNICTPFMCNIFATYSHFNIILLDLYLVDTVLFDWSQMIYNNHYLVMTVILAVTYIVILNLFINRFYNMQNYYCGTLNCILISSHSDIVYKNMIMLLTTMLKRLNVSKIIPDDYNSIISKTPFDSCKHNFNPFYSTAFKFPKLIFEPATIMPVSIAHNSVDTHYIDNSNTNARSTQGQNVNTNVMFTHDRSLLNDIDPDINYIDSKCQLNSRYYTEKEFNDSFKFNDNFSILHLNIRSIPTHFNEFVSYLDTLSIDFKVIGLSETWLTKNHTLYNLANYSVEFDMSPQKTRGWHISIYSLMSSI